MDIRIWKYPLKFRIRQIISMPIGAKILSLQVQDGIPCLWAMVDIEAHRVDTEIVTIATGEACHVDGLPFIGTYQLSGGDLVFHVFGQEGLNSQIS